MLDHTLDQVAAAVRRRDEMVATLRPKIHEFLGQLFRGMIQRELGRLVLQIADEDGVRRYFLDCSPVERFDRLYRVRLAKKPTLTPPLLSAEVFADAAGGLQGVTRALDVEEVAELYTFLSDFQNEEAHARTEVTADAVAVLMKPRAH
jgi:hypothetical protein